MTGGSLAHQDIVFNLRTVLTRLLAGTAFRAAQEMRLRIGNRIRYPDMAVFAGPLDQTTRTLLDALAIFEVLSNDTATTDRVAKLSEYTDVAFAPRLCAPRADRCGGNLAPARSRRTVDCIGAYSG
jgi:hypothetical protein